MWGTFLHYLVPAVYKNGLYVGEGYFSVVNTIYMATTSQQHYCESVTWYNIAAATIGSLNIIFMHVVPYISQSNLNIVEAKGSGCLQVAM